MRIHVAVRAANVETVAATLAAVVALTDGICAIGIDRVSDAFACDGGVCAAALVRTRMGPSDLLDWFDRATDETAAGGVSARAEVLLAEDVEQRGVGIQVPSPLVASGDAMVVALLDLDPEARMPDGRRVADLAAPPSLVRLGPVPGYEREVPHPPPPFDEVVAPEWDEAFEWAAGDAEWVPVTAGWGWHKDIEIKLALLLDAGIPACLHDRPFGDLFDWPWGQLVATPILVAPESLDDARAVLGASFSDEDGEFEVAGCELDALRREAPYLRSRASLWAYLLFTFFSAAIALPMLALVPLVVLLRRPRRMRR